MPTLGTASAFHSKTKMWDLDEKLYVPFGYYAREKMKKTGIRMLPVFIPIRIGAERQQSPVGERRGKLSVAESGGAGAVVGKQSCG